MSKVIMDHRCPSCNRPVKGKTEVSFGKPRNPPTSCQHCQTPIKLTTKQTGLGSEAYYENAGTVDRYRGLKNGTIKPASLSEECVAAGTDWAPPVKSPKFTAEELQAILDLINESLIEPDPTHPDFDGHAIRFLHDAKLKLEASLLPAV